MMQLDPPPGRQEIWSWWANVDSGKSLLNSKQSSLNSTWTARINEWNTWNTQHPGQQVGPPGDRQESGCLLKWNSGNYGSESTNSFKDACWIKRYNGADNGDYLIWKNTPPDENSPYWKIIDTNGLGNPYVANVCSQSP